MNRVQLCFSRSFNDNELIICSRFSDRNAGSRPTPASVARASFIFSTVIFRIKCGPRNEEVQKKALWESLVSHVAVVGRTKNTDLAPTKVISFCLLVCVAGRKCGSKMPRSRNKLDAKRFTQKRRGSKRIEETVR